MMRSEAYACIQENPRSDAEHALRLRCRLSFRYPPRRKRRGSKSVRNDGTGSSGRIAGRRLAVEPLMTRAQGGEDEKQGAEYEDKKDCAEAQPHRVAQRAGT